MFSAISDDRLRERFDESVPDRPQDGCWLWARSRFADGYGRALFREGGKQVSIRASHIALTLAGKPRPDGADALHSCDNPSCVNPAHLRWGNDKMNARDREDRNRRVPVRGVRHGMSKLTDEKVVAIRQDPRTHREVAKDFGVSFSLVAAVRRREIWRQVTVPEPPA